MEPFVNMKRHIWRFISYLRTDGTTDYLITTVNFLKIYSAVLTKLRLVWARPFKEPTSVLAAVEQKQKTDTHAVKAAETRKQRQTTAMMMMMMTEKMKMRKILSRKGKSRRCEERPADQNSGFSTNSLVTVK